MKHLQYSVWVLLLLVLGCTREEITPDPEASFVLTSTDLIQGEAVAFENTSLNAFSFLWSFGDGEVYVGVNASHTYEAPGEYTVTLEANGNGKRSVATQIVTIAGLVPTVAFTVADANNLLAGQPVSFANETENGLSYSWEFGDADGSTSTEENPTFTYAQPGTYEVTLTATGTGGEASASQTVIVQPNAFELYFIDNDAGMLRKIALSDPTAVEDVFSLSGFAFGVVYDPASGYVYYSDDDAGTVMRNTLAGTDEQTIATGLAGPRDLALDADANTLYVVDRSSDAVLGINLVDNSTSTIFDTSDDPNFLLPVGIDFYNGSLYMNAVDFDAETIWTGNPDGTGLTKIIDYNAGGFGYGLAVNPANGRIYFDDNDGGNILSAAPDGTDIQTVAAATDRAYGIVVDAENSKLYWATRDGALKESDLDGSNEKAITTGSGDVRGIFIRKAD